MSQSKSDQLQPKLLSLSTYFIYFVFESVVADGGGRRATND